MLGKRDFQAGLTLIFPLLPLLCHQWVSVSMRKRSRVLPRPHEETELQTKSAASIEEFPTGVNEKEWFIIFFID